MGWVGLGGVGGGERATLAGCATLIKSRTRTHCLQRRLGVCRTSRVCVPPTRALLAPAPPSLRLQQVPMELTVYSAAGPASWDWVQQHGGWTLRSTDRCDRLRRNAYTLAAPPCRPAGCACGGHEPGDPKREEVKPDRTYVPL